MFLFRAPEVRPPKYFLKEVEPHKIEMTTSKQIKKLFYRLSGLIFFASAFFITNNKVLAAGASGSWGEPTGGTGGPTGGTGGATLDNPLGADNIIQIINNILNYLIYISVPILALMILIGGFYILTAKDDPAKITKGRTTIMYAAIGFTIILISKGVALILLTIIG